MRRVNELGLAPHTNALFPLCAAAVIHYCASARGTVLDWPPLAWLGRISYSLYLWQEPFCWESRLGVLGSLPLNIIASLVMACANFYVVEKPVLRLRNRLLRGGRRDCRSRLGPNRRGLKRMTWAFAPFSEVLASAPSAGPRLINRLSVRFCLGHSFPSNRQPFAQKTQGARGVVSKAQRQTG